MTSTGEGNGRYPAKPLNSRLMNPAKPDCFASTGEGERPLLDQTTQFQIICTQAS
ncbi:MAG: hypothetical protein M5U34_29260 [Chloroflexi bacterium]|nr:hypothetical protein [Chloroflexota bacterium]